jgi:hypothetical protein
MNDWLGGAMDSKHCWSMGLVVLLSLAACASAPPAPVAPAKASLVPPRISLNDRKLENVTWLARRGDLRAMHNLCYRYVHGKYGAAHNDAEALLWCTRAAEEGAGGAQLLLADMYYAGKGVPRDHAVAFRWYLAAADEESDEAHLKLHTLYAQGQGVAADPSKAITHLRIAADMGNRDAVKKLSALDASWKPQAASTEVARDDPDLVAMDPAPGTFQDEHYRFDPLRGQQLEVSLDVAKDDPKWAPLQSICVMSQDPNKSMCLRFHIRYEDKSVVEVKTLVLSADHHTYLDDKKLALAFRRGEKLRVQTIAEQGKLRFLINGKLAASLPLDYVPDMLHIACSTADCRFRFLQPGMKGTEP